MLYFALMLWASQEDHPDQTGTAFKARTPEMGAYVNQALLFWSLSFTNGILPFPAEGLVSR